MGCGLCDKKKLAAKNYTFTDLDGDFAKEGFGVYMALSNGFPKGTNRSFFLPTSSG